MFVCVRNVEAPSLFYNFSAACRAIQSNLNGVNANKFILICVLMLLLYPAFPAKGSDLDWLGDQQQDFVLQGHYGADNQDNNLYGLKFTAPMPAFNSLDLYFARAEADSGTDLDHYGFYWHTDPVMLWSAGLGYQFTGKSNIIEIPDYLAHVTYYPNNWSFSVNYLDEKLIGFLQPANRPRLNARTRVEVNRLGMGLSVVYSDYNWSAHLAAMDYDYDRDLSQLDDSLLRLRRIQPAVLDQLFQLSNWDLQADFRYRFDVVAFTMGTQVYQATIAEETVKKLYLNFDFALSDRFQLETYYSHLDGDGGSYGELTLGTSW